MDSTVSDGSIDDLRDGLRRARAQYRTLVDSMDLGYILVEIITDDQGRTVDLRYLDANAKAVKMTGADLVGRTTRELSPDFEPHWFETFGRVARTGVGERHELSAAPLNVYYDFYVFKVGDPDTRQVVALYQDVTERTLAQATLTDEATRKDFLLALSDAIGTLLDPIAIQAAATQLLVEHLDTARAFYGESYDDGTFVIATDFVRAEANSVTGVYRFDDFPPVGEQLRAGHTFVANDLVTSPVVDPLVAERFGTYGVRAQIAVPLIKSGRLVAALMVNQPVPRTWTALEISLVQETAERTWAAVVRARSEAALRRSEEALRRAHDELETRVQERTKELARLNTALETELDERRTAEERIKGLFAQLVTAQEEERRRIARDLHDQLGQQMTALKLSLEALPVQADPAMSESVDRARSLAEELDRSIDSLTWQLRPAVLDHLGLPDALNQLVTTWSEGFGISARYHSDLWTSARFPSDVEANLYRIAQEALHNVYKHAHASGVVVRWQQRERACVLEIVDDGRGFAGGEEAHPQQANGLGLVNMRERAALAGGTLSIQSSAAGTTVRVALDAPR